MAETAFVAGATGYTGRHVVERLVARNVRTIAHVRTDSARLAEWQQRFGDLGAEVDTTAWQLEAMKATMARLAPTRVFALLGTTRTRARDEGMGASEAYEAIDYGLTRLLLDAVVGADLAPRFVYLSAAGLSETTRNPYMRARVRAEAAIRDSGVPFTFARPSFITGSDRDDSRPMERIGAAVGDGLLAVVGALGGRKLRARYRSTTAEILASALVDVAFDPAAENRIVEADELRPRRDR